MDPASPHHQGQGNPFLHALPWRRHRTRLDCLVCAAPCWQDQGPNHWPKQNPWAVPRGLKVQEVSRSCYDLAAEVSKWWMAGVGAIHQRTDADLMFVGGRLSHGFSPDQSGTGCSGRSAAQCRGRSRSPAWPNARSRSQQIRQNRSVVRIVSCVFQSVWANWVSWAESADGDFSSNVVLFWGWTWSPTASLALLKTAAPRESPVKVGGAIAAWNQVTSGCCRTLVLDGARLCWHGSADPSIPRPEDRWWPWIQHRHLPCQRRRNPTCGLFPDQAANSICSLSRTRQRGAEGPPLRHRRRGCQHQWSFNTRNYEPDSLKALKKVTGRVEKCRSQRLVKLAAWVRNSPESGRWIDFTVHPLGGRLPDRPRGSAGGAGCTGTPSVKSAALATLLSPRYAWQKLQATKRMMTLMGQVSRKSLN